MIKRMKQGRVVLLTTHAMEEADALADRIAVMKEGEIKCIGTSLYLKNNFTDGYRYLVISLFLIPIGLMLYVTSRKKNRSSMN